MKDIFDKKSNIRKYGISFLILIGVLIFCISLFALYSQQWLKITSVGLLMGISSFTSGGTLGFIFGLPTYKNDESDTWYVRNTSLKDITDWITKIIVGVTLVELKSIIVYFQNLVFNISSYLDINYAGIVFSSTVIVSSFFLGFVLVYLLTITEFIGYLAKNDMKINSILKGIPTTNDDLKLTGIMGMDTPLDQVSNSDVNLDQASKSKILNFVVKNGTTIEDIQLAKKLAKILFLMGEYDKSADLFNRVFDLDSSVKGPKLNEAFIRSKYLKDTKKSNEILKELIVKFPSDGIPNYNIACNYNRELKDLGNNLDSKNPYVIELKSKIKENLAAALSKDKALITEALKDRELEGVDVEDIFNEVIGNINKKTATK